jgi:hypothetical protein
MGNMGSVTDNVCDIKFDTEDIECDERRHCKKKLKISHANDSPITKPVCKTFWKEACAKEGGKCNVNAVASIDFNSISNTEPNRSYKYMFDRQTWKNNAEFISDFMKIILHDMKNNKNRYIQLTNYVIRIWEYTDKILDTEKSMQLYQNGTKRKEQIENIKKQYDAMISDKIMWKYLTEHGIEYKGKLNAAIHIIHRNIMNRLDPQHKVPWDAAVRHWNLRRR